MARKHKLPTPPRRSWGAVSTMLVALKGDAEAMEAYLEAVESGREDYLAHDCLNGTRWVGGGAAALGLAGRLREGELTGLLIGRPIDQLANENADLVVSKSRRVNGWDVELAPPKGFSAMLAAASPDWREAGLRIHMAAGAKAIQAIDESIGARRGAQGMGGWQRAPGIIGAQTLHMTSREDDPHFHTHFTLSNRVELPKGKTLTIDSEMFHDSWPTATTVYGRELRRLSLLLLGVEWEGPDTAGHFTPKGVPEAVIEMWSKRTEVIEQYMADNPGVSEDWAARVTRPNKNLTETASEKFIRWGDEAMAAAPEWTHQMRTTRTPLAMRLGGLNDPMFFPVQEPPDAAVVDQVIEDAAEAITNRVAVWDIIEARQTICELAPIEWTWEQVCGTAAALAARKDLVCAQRAPAGGGLDSIRPGGNRMATWKLINAEARISEFFSADQPQRPNIDASIAAGERAIHNAYRRDGLGLDDNQTEAVQAIAAGGRGHVIVGPAGTGKTTLFKAVSQWAKHLEMDMVGMATAQSAADLIGDAMDCEGVNITRGLNQDKIPHNGLVVLDEASMINTLHIANVVDIASARNTVVVLAGDPGQLDPPEGPGGMLKSLDYDPDMAVSRLEVAWRFNHEWERKASLRLRDQDLGVLSTYLHHGRVIGLTPDIPVEQTDRRVVVGAERLADMAVEQMNAGHRVIVSTTSNDEAELVNRNIQQQLFPHRETHTIRCGGKAIRIGAGDRIITRHNNFQIRTTMDKPIINGNAWIVDSIEGDGSLKVAAVDPEIGSVILPREYLDQVPHPGKPRAIQLGWASTSHVAQGRTEEFSIGWVNRNTTNAKGLHVMGTRGREENVFVAVGDDSEAIEAFTSAIRRSREPVAARDALEPASASPEPPESPATALEPAPAAAEPPEEAPEPDPRMLAAATAAHRRLQQAQSTRRRTVRAAENARSVLQRAARRVSETIKALRVPLNVLERGFARRTLTAEQRTETVQETRTRFDEYRQALDRFEAAKAGFEAALNAVGTANARLRDAGHELAAAYTELTEAQAAAAGIRNLITKPIDTTTPVLNIQEDLRRVEDNIASLNPQLQRLGLVPIAGPHSPVVEPEPEPAAPPRTLQEFFARAPAEFSMTHDELRRRFHALPDHPEQIKQAWRTLQTITEPKPDDDLGDDQRARPSRRGPGLNVDDPRSADRSAAESVPAVTGAQPAPEVEPGDDLVAEL